MPQLRPDHLDELLVPPRAVGHERAQAVGLRLELASRRGRGFCTRSHHSRWPPRIATASGQKSPLGDDVDRRAHERRLHDRAPFERARQVITPEAVEARPEPDVRVRGVLVLDPADALERARDRERRAFEQELAREQRAVQLALREDSLGHAATLADR